MGSPLAPFHANVFMPFFERKYMSEIKSIGLKVWLRYANDIFATLNKKNEAIMVLSYLNSRHHSI